MFAEALPSGRNRYLAACAGLWLLCAPAARGVAAGVSKHSDAPGIDWYAGDVAAAFAEAQKEHKPVFLYWGATWCPPCQQLKSSVFTRSDFIAKTHQFVAVYLDGDEPGAQKWGEKFHVLGYPTVVILRPDQREVTRLSGGMDLSLYADLLDSAENDITPIDEVMAMLASNPASLSHGDCQRLAYYAWELADYTEDQRAKLGPSLAGAAGSCPGMSETERARLTVIAATLSASAVTVPKIAAIIADAKIAPAVADALEGLDKDFFAAVLAQGPAVSEKFRADWERTMDAVSNDPHRIDADQLYALGEKLVLIKQFIAPLALPAPLSDAAHRRVSAALARSADPYVRSGVVNAAGFVYEQLGDDAAEEAMLRGELATSRTPYYYMVDLGDLEEKRGNKSAAIAWFERAYHDSQGTATRFQWGNIYLSALLRLDPTGRQRIRRVAAAVIGDLNGPDRIQARTRLSLGKLDVRLRQWDSAHRYDADLREIRRQMQGVCAHLAGDDAGLASCRSFLAGPA